MVFKSPCYKYFCLNINKRNQTYNIYIYLDRYIQNKNKSIYIHWIINDIN